MRRLIASILALSVLGAFVGCCCDHECCDCGHVAGRCDCAGPGDTCCYGHGPGNPIDPVYHGQATPALNGEFHAAPALQAMPQGNVIIQPSAR